MTVNRRDLLIGGGCAAALGTATWLQPRERLTLLRPNRTLAAIIPNKLGAWQVAPGGDIVIPRTPGTLATRLYSDSLARAYRSPALAEDVMLLVAYGQAQNDLLQLHRPEVCYPAIGFEISDRQLVRLPLANGATIPAVMLTATAGGRTEDIVYWTRTGEDLPQTRTEQNADRLRAAMRGYVGDGVLVRASIVRGDDTPQFAPLAGFMAALVGAVPAPDRPALIGTALSRSIA